jgi:Methyltransferase domain
MSEPPLRKMEIVKLLRRKYGLGAFLEISTPSTGQFFSEVMDDILDAHRLVYMCPREADDGRTYTYRTEATTSHELTNAILTANRNVPCYDIIFVDPYHTYASSSIDLSGAFALLRPGGFMVVHDCNPADASITSPEHTPGDWCGVTYMAFIDFTLCREGLSYYTVDTDFGCGVIYKHPQRAVAASHRLNGARDRLAFAWDAARHDDATRFHFFAQHRRDLLNLKSVEEFSALEGFAPAPAAMTEG